jgi:hypothetical protein
VAVQDVSAFGMQLHGTPFSASHPFFPATSTLEAFALPRHGVDAQLSFDEANLKVFAAINPVPDSTLEVFEKRHNSAETTVFWTQGD